MSTDTNSNAHHFKYCPSCGKTEIGARSVKSIFCQSCGFSLYINCAAAAMALITDAQGKLLLTIRKNDPAKGAYDFPGGFIEPGETLENGIMREVQEELNLEITESVYLCSFPNTYLFNKIAYPVTDSAFLCKVKTLEAICAGDDVDGFEFFEPDRLTPDLFEMDSPRKVLSFYLASSRCQENTTK